MRKTCRECGRAASLRNGLCRRCRSEAGGPDEVRRGQPPATPDLEPTHDQPWVPTNQLADRVRRSPRE